MHTCPHLNARSVDVFQAVREAAGVRMRALGLMDNFCNSAGYAALAMRELGALGVEVFGGLIMEPPAGGVTVEAAQAALAYGYGSGTGARFISLPTHHTRHVAHQEGRGSAYADACLGIPERGPLPEPLPAILDLIAAHDVVLNTGHLSGPEALRVVEKAKARGVERILVPCSHYEPEVIAALTGAGAHAEFSFFFVSHATQIGLTHVDRERHTIAAVPVARLTERIRAATPQRSVVSGDCGVAALPPPVEGLREFLLLLESCDFSRDELRIMVAHNPAALFRVGSAAASASA